MKIKNYITGGIVSMLLLPGCTNEIAVTPDTSNGEVLFTATLDDGAFATKATPTAAPAGTYYLGYTTSKDTVSAVTVTGSEGAVSGTGIYWMNVALTNNNKSAFSLSNVKRENDQDIIPEDRDILWAKSEKKKGEKLDFTLKHLMAQTKVTIKVPDNWEDNITEVSLVNMQNDIKFDRKAGKADAAGDKTTITLSPLADGKYGSILPPQDRQDKMVLKVETEQGKIYQRPLPGSMDELTEGGTWAGITLRFRAGYILEITAEIKESLDFTIFFTGATLQDWNYIGTSTIPARPVGIYTPGDLKQWIEDYNAVKKGTKESYVLNKYGALSEGKWTFYLRRNIDASSIDGAVKIADFTDTLTQQSSGTYKISGKSQSDLLTIGTNGTVADNIFATNNNP